ncbi:MAG: mycofactocin system transcriptional regulator [Streptosporangiales bacterium]|nr:mycofactocin system transcriptional regulator [Streptosporangiales bacterium]
MAQRSAAAVPPKAARGGRPAATSHVDLAHVALELFSTRGFEATTVDDIADTAGIGRRTFFRYFSSKNDAVWGDFDAELRRMEDYLAARPADEPYMTALHGAILDFNTYSAAEAPWHRRRMELILTVPALQAHSTLRYADWRQVVAAFVAGRLGAAADDLVPQTVAYALLAVCVAAYERWLADPGAELTALLDAGLRLLESGLRT